MWATVCDAVEADDELKLVARVDLDDSLEDLVSGGAEVAVDFTAPDAVKENVRFCLDHGIHAVVGTTGWTVADLKEIESWTGKANAFVAPNFAIGAVLMMVFSSRAAAHFETAEIVERHHEKKIDAPSGTALKTASGMNEARSEPWMETPGGDDPSRGLDVDGIRVHSVRTPGSVAHQEVILGGPGETLTIRHDSIDRKSFMPGVLIAVKSVASRPGLTVGLENLLDL